MKCSTENCTGEVTARILTCTHVYCTNCVAEEDDCPQCDSDLLDSAEVEPDYQEPSQHYELQQLCTQHGLHLDQYCETCKRPVCADCCRDVDDPQHDESASGVSSDEQGDGDDDDRQCCHPRNEVKSKNDYLRMLAEIMENDSTINSRETLKRILQLCDEQQKMFAEKFDNLKKQIAAYTQELRTKLVEKEKVLNDLAHGMTEKQAEILKQYKHSVERLDKQLEKGETIVSQGLHTAGVAHYRKVFTEAHDAVTRAAELSHQSLPPELQVPIIFRDNFAESIINEFKLKLGQMVCLGVPAGPHNIRFQGLGARMAIACTRTKFNIVVVDEITEPPCLIVDEVTCTLKLLPNLEYKSDVDCCSTCEVPPAEVGTDQSTSNNEIPCLCEKVTKRKYKVSYTAHRLGDYSVHARIGGVSVPFPFSTISVVPPLQQYHYDADAAETKRSQVRVKCIKQPHGISVTNDGMMAIALTSAEQIMIKEFGTPRKIFGKMGTAGGQFREPSDVAFMTKRDPTEVLVSDTGNHRIQKLTIKGQLVAEVGKKGVNAFEFDRPTAIAIDHRKGRVLIVEVGNKRVQVLSYDLKFFQFFIRCPRNGVLTSVGVDVDGMIYVGCESHYIHKYNQNGEHCMSFEHSDDLSKPSCICVSHHGLVFVGDASKNTIIVFDADGKCLDRLDHICGHGQFGNPSGLAIDFKNSLYYSDAENCCVYVLRQ